MALFFYVSEDKHNSPKKLISVSSIVQLENHENFTKIITVNEELKVESSIEMVAQELALDEHYVFLKKYDDGRKAEFGW